MSWVWKPGGAIDVMVEVVGMEREAEEDGGNGGGNGGGGTWVDAC